MISFKIMNICCKKFVGIFNSANLGSLLPLCILTKKIVGSFNGADWGTLAAKNYPESV
jgi:hypothetical protein